MKKSFRPKKRLGQNFLYDPAIAERIAAATSLAAGDVVVELGAGRGILTDALVARGVRLIALEVDPPLFDALVARYAKGDTATGPAPEIVNADLTKVTLAEMLRERGLERCTLVGNIPYYLTRDVLFDYLVYANDAIDAAFIMMQREVAERIVSPPGGRVYGITSVILQTLYEVRTVMKVAPGSFQPPPKVASSVLAFEPVKESFIAPHELKPLVALVKNLFQQRRKTISNSLRAHYDLAPEALAEIEASAGVDLQLRPEALSKERFIALLRHIPEGSS